MSSHGPADWLSTSLGRQLLAAEGELLRGLLGGYRGVSEAALAYAGAAQAVNCSHWREERFS